MTDRADDADWGTAKEITVTGFLASDRADEIQACTRIFEESFRHGADSEYALDALRAYGDECRNAALEEAAVRVGREIVWAEYAEQEAYEESDHVVGAAMCKLTPKLYELMDTIRALKEKP